MSSTLRIDGIDKLTLLRLSMESERRGIDVSAVAIEALKRGLPQTALLTTLLPSPELHHDLDWILGTMTDKDVSEFESATSAFRAIDTEMWE